MQYKLFYDMTTITYNNLEQAQLKHCMYIVDTRSELTSLAHSLHIRSIDYRRRHVITDTP